MGRKPFVGMFGLCLAGAVVIGCAHRQNYEGGRTRQVPPPMVGANTTQNPAAWTNPSPNQSAGTPAGSYGTVAPGGSYGTVMPAGSYGSGVRPTGTVAPGSVESTGPSRIPGSVNSTPGFPQSDAAVQPASGSTGATISRSPALPDGLNDPRRTEAPGSSTADPASPNPCPPEVVAPPLSTGSTDLPRAAAPSGGAVMRDGPVLAPGTGAGTPRVLSTDTYPGNNPLPPPVSPTGSASALPPVTPSTGPGAASGEIMTTGGNGPTIPSLPPETKYEGKVVPPPPLPQSRYRNSPLPVDVPAPSKVSIPASGP
jgi:hypothetical protein